MDSMQRQSEEYLKLLLKGDERDSELPMGRRTMYTSKSEPGKSLSYSAVDLSGPKLCTGFFDLQS